MTGAPDDEGAAAPEPCDPHILAIARAIGRLIARERFKTATEVRDKGEEALEDA